MIFENPGEGRVKENKITAKIMSGILVFQDRSRIRVGDYHPIFVDPEQLDKFLPEPMLLYDHVVISRYIDCIDILVKKIE
jgi:hypothetical protein